VPVVGHLDVKAGLEDLPDYRGQQTRRSATRRPSATRDDDPRRLLLFPESSREPEPAPHSCSARRGGAVSGTRSARQHFLDGLPRDPEFSRDLRLRHPVAYEFAEQVSPLRGELACQDRVFDGLSAELADAVDGFLPCCSAVFRSHIEIMTTGRCHVNHTLSQRPLVPSALPWRNR
jgi:hypothetical protein